MSHKDIITESKVLSHLRNIYSFDKMRKAGSVLLIATLILPSVLNIIPFSTMAGPFTTVTVETEPLAEVDVSPGSSGLAAVQGIVTCENINTVTPLIVTLIAQSTIGNPTLDQTQIVFQGNHQTEEITILIQVPIFTSASEDHTCSVSGTWEQGATSGSVEPDTFQIIILPFSYCNITCDSPKKEVTQGDSASFNLNLNNAGNIDDVYTVDIANRDELEEKGITIHAIDEIAILEQGSEEIEVIVRTSSDTSERVYNITVVISSRVVEEPVEFEFLLHLRVKGKIVGLDVLSSPIILIIFAIIIIVGIVVYKKKR